MAEKIPARPIARAGTAFHLLKVLVLAGVYFTSAKWGLSLSAVSRVATAIWPPSGIALAILLVFGRGLWPGVTLGAFLVNVSIGVPIPGALGMAVGNTLEPWIASYLLGELLNFGVHLDRVVDVVKLIGVGALFSTLISATGGVLSGILSGMISSGDMLAAWRTWWIGDMMGVLIVTPPLVVWCSSFSQSKNIGTRINARQALEVSLLFLVLIFVTLSVFLEWFGRAPESFFHPYYLFPLLSWAALRFEQRTVTVGVLIASLVSVWSTLRGHGPYAAAPLNESLPLLETFNGVLAITALLLSATNMERRRALRAKDEFLSIASHELKTPLTAMKMHLQLFQRNLKMGRAPNLTLEAIQAMVQSTDRQLDRLVDLVDKMLDISRISIGKFALQTERLDLSQLVHEVVERFLPQIRAEDGKIEEDLQPAIMGDWDRLRLEQVVTNLISNAQKYGGHRGIRITTRSEGQLARLQVEDHGIGIAAEDISRIFGRFERAISAQHISGMGLGLYISRQIIDAHHGSISVRSGLGKGSTFTVELPLVRE